MTHTIFYFIVRLIREINENYFNQNRLLKYLFVIFVISSSLQLNASELSYITPIYVNTITTPYEEYNDINPNWSPDGSVISYERFNSVNREIVISDNNGKRIKRVSSNNKKKDEFDTLMPDFSEEIEFSYFSFNINWHKNNKEYVFISNGDNNNFDIYQGNINTDSIKQITRHAAIDNQAQWSPKSNEIIFVSSRNNNASLFLYNSTLKKISTVLSISQDAINPIWSPSGRKLAFMLGEGNNYQIFVIDDIKNPEDTLRKITNLPLHNNIRPSWSPDGRKIAFFSMPFSSEIKSHWNIIVVDSNIQTPISGSDLLNSTVSSHIIQNSLSGPAWLPDSHHIAYIQYVNDLYNPIHLVNIYNKHQSLIVTNTKMNRDVNCSINGTLIFQSQDEQWSRIFIAQLPGFKG